RAFPPADAAVGALELTSTFPATNRCPLSDSVSAAPAEGFMTSSEPGVKLAASKRRSSSASNVSGRRTADLRCDGLAPRPSSLRIQVDTTVLQLERGELACVYCRPRALMPEILGRIGGCYGARRMNLAPRLEIVSLKIRMPI